MSVATNERAQFGKVGDGFDSETRAEACKIIRLPFAHYLHPLGFLNDQLAAERPEPFIAVCNQVSHRRADAARLKPPITEGVR